MNNNLIEFLKKEISENKISHAFLVETNNCELLLNELVNFLKKQKIITSQTMDNNICIDIIRPENNLIDRNKILELQKFIVTKSVINEYKVYFIINAELMNLSSFNKLLKVLEEPCDNVIGFLITENMNQIISTIKSRCKRFKMEFNTEQTKLIDEDLFKMLISIKKLTFTELLNLKKLVISQEKQNIIFLLEKYKKYISSQNLSIDEIKTLANSYKILDNIIDLIKSNVNLELCLDKMIIEMRK